MPTSYNSQDERSRRKPSGERPHRQHSATGAEFHRSEIKLSIAVTVPLVGNGSKSMILGHPFDKYDTTPPLL